MTSLGTETAALRPNGNAPVILPQYKQYADSTAVSFKTFAPRDPSTQAKYDAMSPTWQGIDSTNSAIARGDFKLDSTPSTTYDPKVAPAQSSDWFCVVQ